MLSRNFLIREPEKAIKKARTILFKGSKPLIERRSIKYIKQARCTTYITVNPNETRKLEFENGENDGDGQFVAKSVDDKLVHLCANQILIIRRFAFCFEASVSHTGNESD